jgi:hypothetical protein
MIEIGKTNLEMLIIQSVTWKPRMFPGVVNFLAYIPKNRWLSLKYFKKSVVCKTFVCFSFIDF